MNVKAEERAWRAKRPTAMSDASAPTFMRLGVLLVPEFCTDANLRLVRQCGATDIVLTCPGFSLEELESAVNRIQQFGLKVDVIERFVPHDKIVHGLPGREEQVENIKRLARNMGKCGVKTLCYNWMPSDDWTRTATDLPDRGGALCTAFDVRGRVHTLAGQTHQAAEVVTPASQLWQTLEAFLREVLPVCEECGVSLALHPDDPPLATLHGKPQIVYNVAEIAKVPLLVPSPANGICFCAGTFASAGIDVPAAIRSLGKAIKFVHSRTRQPESGHKRERTRAHTYVYTCHSPCGRPRARRRDVPVRAHLHATCACT